MADELDLVLQGLRGGGTLDSSGRFMLDLRQARDKLRRFQLAEPAFYLLKLVQAAVASKAPGINVRFRRRQVSVSFSPAPGPAATKMADSRALLNALTTTSSSPDLHHLAVALNAAWGMKPELVRFSNWQDGQGWSLNIEAGDMRLDDFDQKPGWAGNDQRQWVEFMLERPASLKNYAKGVAGEHRAVLTRCAFSSAKITLDGKTLQGGWGAAPKAAWHARMSPPFYLVERYFVDPEGALALGYPQLKGCEGQAGAFLNTSPIQGDENTIFPPFCVEFTDIPDSERVLCNRAMALPLALHGPARLYFVKDGVTLDTIECQLGVPGMIMVTDGSDLQTDISEFGVVKNAVYESYLAGLREDAIETVELLAANLEQLPAHSTEQSAAVGLGWVVGCAMGGPAAGCLLGMLARYLGGAFSGNRSQKLQNAVREKIKNLY